MATESELLEQVLTLIEGDRAATRLVSGTATSTSADVALIRLRDGRTGRLPVTETAPGHKPRENDTVILAEIEPGPRPLLSATRPELLPLLLDGIVPELRDGTIRIMGVARRVGVRSKIAVSATVDGVDPVGALLGRGAGRIRVASRLLGGERIDVVAWHPDKARYAVNALAVSAVSAAQQDDGTIAIVVPSHQVQAAIGGGKLNVGLASQLVRARIAIEGA